MHGLCLCCCKLEVDFLIKLLISDVECFVRRLVIHFLLTLLLKPRSLRMTPICYDLIDFRAQVLYFLFDKVIAGCRLLSFESL